MDDLLIMGLAFPAAMLLLWVLFVNVMWLKPRVDSWPMLLRIPAYIFGAIAFLYDVLFNIVFGTIMFLEFPDFKGAHAKYMPTLSERLKDVLRGTRNAPVYGFRWKMALFICSKMIEPWDKNHCGLEDL